VSVKHAVLGLVIERPGYGYELIQRLEERVGGWKPSATAVYPALQLLSRRELIRARETPGGHRGVIWYEATEAGEEHFRTWMDTPSDLAPLREELLLKLAFARVEDLPRLIELTREQEQACLDRIVELTGPGDVEALAAEDKPWPMLAGLLLRDAELDRLRASIATLQRCRATMKAALRRERERGGGTS
jgi:DNA-binding PadR family transcriptional regulator